MERRSIVHVVVAAALACGCGGKDGAALEPSGSGDGSDVVSPVVPAPDETPAPIAPELTRATLRPACRIRRDVDFL